MPVPHTSRVHDHDEDHRKALPEPGFRILADGVMAILYAGFNGQATTKRLLQSAPDPGCSDSISVITLSVPAKGEY